MTITERTLRNWRRDALTKLYSLANFPPSSKTGEEINIVSLLEKEYCERIVRLTQELMDMNLVRKG